MAKKQSTEQEPAKAAEEERYVVTARKWRPMVFEDVVGQSHVTQTLRNAITTGRIHHAFIFSGPRGVGKTTTARLLAKILNCLHPTAENNPDNTCELCQEITEGRSVNVFEIDGASNRGIDEIRNLRESVRYAPARGKYKIYIIDEAHMLTKEAWNALLKTLEEPPEYVIFIFATTEVHKILPTILSRCQRFDFRRNTIEEIAGRLGVIAKAEQIEISTDALLHIAKQADGSMRDGQSIFDQIVSFGGRSIDAKLVEQALNIVNQDLFFRCTDLLTAKDQPGILGLVDDLVIQGVDLAEFLQGLTEHFRNIMVARLTKASKLIEATEVHKKQYMAEAERFGETRLLRCIQLANETAAALRFSRHPRYRVEVCLLMMLRIDESVEIGELLEKLEEVKKSLQTVPSPQPGARNTLFGGPTISTSTQPASGAPQAAGSEVSRAGVRGSVRAGQPLLRPDQVIPTFGTQARPSLGSVVKPSIELAIPVTSGQFDTLTSAPTGTSGTSEPGAPYYDASRTTSTLPAEEKIVATNLSIEDVRNKWPEVIAACKGKVGIVTILEETDLVDMRGDRVRLSCPNEFSLDVLRRNKDYLTELTQTVYGCRLRIEGALGMAVPTQESSAATPSPVAAKRVAPEDTSKHPIVQALMREVGARPV